MKIKKYIYFTILVSIFTIKSADAGFERFIKGLEAKGGTFIELTQSGCGGNDKLPFGIKIENGMASGIIMPSGDNPPEKKKPHKFKFKIRDDGTFGGESGDDYRFWLRRHSSGSPKYQWVSGTVSDSQIKIKVVYGAPSHPESFCESTGSAAR